MRKIVSAACFIVAALGVAAFVLPIPPAVAGTCNIDDLPTTGTITGARLNARFAQGEACINGKLGDSNLSTSEPISLSKLSKPTALSYVTAQLDCTSNATDKMEFKPAFAGKIVSMSSKCKGCVSGDSFAALLKVDGSTIHTDDVTASETIFTTSSLSTAVTASSTVTMQFDRSDGPASCKHIDIVVGIDTNHQPAL